MSMRLDGKVAIVTGAGSGNGRGIAIGLASAGAAVCAADMMFSTAQETAAKIVSDGGRAIAAEVDVAKRSSIDGMMDTVMREFGRLDVLVNNAGTTNRDALVDVPEQEFDRVIAVNLKGPFMCTQAAVPRMSASGGGSIINIVSTSAELAPANISVYTASKGGLEALTRAMAVELARFNIRANGIIPGMTITGLTRAHMTPEKTERWLSRIPLGRLGQPEDYAGVAILLASDASSWMTGSMICVDGGYLACG